MAGEMTELVPSLNDLNMESKEPQTGDKSLINQQDKDEGDDQNYQKIIKINLLPVELQSEDSTEPTVDRSMTEDDVDSIETTSLVTDEERETDLTDKSCKLYPNVKDLNEDRIDFNSRENIETKLESVYESGRVIEDEDNFKIILNVKKFLRGSMSVKSKGHHIFLIDAQADNLDDPEDKIYLTKRFFIPGRVDMQKTSTSLSSDGILVISVPKLPELKIPKRSDDSCYEELKEIEENRTNVAKNDLESRFRSSDEKIRTESPSKLEELEARIKARKQASKVSSSMVDDRRYSDNEMKNIRKKDEEEIISNKNYNINQEERRTSEGRDKIFSRFDREADEEDFFADRGWNSRKKDSDWLREYVGQFVDEEEWFGPKEQRDDRRRSDFDRRRSESDRRRESKRDWLEKKIKGGFEQRFFNNKDVFGSKVGDFFSNDEDDFFSSRRRPRNSEDRATQKARLNAGRTNDYRHVFNDENRSDECSNDGATNKKHFYSETKRQFSSTSTDGGSQPEPKRNETFNKEDYSSSSTQSKSAKDYSDEQTQFPSRRLNSERLEEITENFRKNSDSVFDFPIVRRGRFFQDSCFDDAKEDFNSIVDRFRQRTRKFGTKQEDESAFKSESSQHNKRHKTVICEDDTCFKIEVPVEGVKEETLTVKELIGNEILIEGEKKNGEGTFKKQIVFPIHGDFKRAKSFLASDDVLIVKVPKVKVRRTVPIGSSF